MSQNLSFQNFTYHLWMLVIEDCNIGHDQSLTSRDYFLVKITIISNHRFVGWTHEQHLSICIGIFSKKFVVIVFLIQVDQVKSKRATNILPDLRITDLLLFIHLRDLIDFPNQLVQMIFHWKHFLFFCCDHFIQIFNELINS